MYAKHGKHIFKGKVYIIVVFECITLNCVGENNTLVKVKVRPQVKSRNRPNISSLCLKQGNRAAASNSSNFKKHRYFILKKFGKGIMSSGCFRLSKNWEASYLHVFDFILL